MSRTIRVLLADDHPTLRLGLRVLLDQAPNVEVMGEAEDGEEALAQIEALQPNVVVLDCQLPRMSGPEVAAEIKQRGLHTKVLALSAYSDDRYVRGMLEAGAVGYLLKSEAPEVIVAAVRAAAREEGYFSTAAMPTPDLAMLCGRGINRARPRMTCALLSKSSSSLMRSG